MLTRQSALLPVYKSSSLAFVEGKGVWLRSVNGEEYLDFGAGIAVMSLGHSHPHLVAALVQQGQKLWHTSNLYRIPEEERLAQRLTELSFADVVFFTNSGAEAVECAIKMARKYHANRGHPEKFRILTFEKAFHGRTLATIAAGGREQYLAGFGPKVEGFDQVRFQDYEDLCAHVRPETAGILLEPIQGEGGIRCFEKNFLQAVYQFCKAQNLLLIFDEVQTGMGRTGTLFAYEQSGISPDIMALAKGLGGGFPLGACLASLEASEGMGIGSHGSTYGGNPLAMAIGNAVLDVVAEPSLLTSVQIHGKKLFSELQKLAENYPTLIKEIRGKGLMIGVSLHIPAVDLISAAQEENLLILAAGTSLVRLVPPLIIEESHVAEAMRRLQLACEKVRQQENLFSAE